MNFVLLPSPERKDQKRELLGLISARADFNACITACNLLLDQASSLASELNHPLLVAVVISYARPFTNNKPHGELPRRYIRLMSPEDRLLHGELIDQRHQFFAHSDFTQRKAYIVPAGVPLAKKDPKPLHFAKTGTAIRDVKYSNKRIIRISSMATAMRDRLSSDIELLLEELYGGMELPREKFELRINNGL